MFCHTTIAAAMLMPGWRPLSTGYQDSATHPVRCHYQLEEDAGRCALVLESVALAWDEQVTRIGFPAPVPDEDGLLDVYLAVDSDGGAYAWCGINGDQDPEDGRSGCAAIIVVSNSVPDGVLPWYLVHEFNHTLQFAIDFNESTRPIWEGTATAAELWTDPERFNPDLGYIEDYQSTPWLGLLGDGSFLWDTYELWSYYEYGAALWVLHADASYGDGRGSGGRDLWLALAQEGLPNDPDVLDGYDTISGDWRQALMDFSIARTRIGTPNAPGWSQFTGERGKLVPEAFVQDYPAALTPAVQPFETGAVFWVLEGVPQGKQVELELSGQGEWGLLWVQGSESGWERGESLEFISSDQEIWVGAVNLDKSDFARIGLTAALTAGQQDISLSVSLSEVSEPIDTADTGQDSTEPSPVEPKGCGGCGGGGGLGLWVVGLLAVGLRRRR